MSSEVACQAVASREGWRRPVAKPESTFKAFLDPESFRASE